MIFMETATASPNTQAPYPNSTMTNPTAPRRLQRGDGPLGGVSAGVADYFDVDPALVRLAAVAVTLMTGPAIPVAYIAAWIIVPKAEANSVMPPPPTGAPVDYVPAPPSANPTSDVITDADAPAPAPASPAN